MGTKEAEKSPVVMTCDTLDAPLEEVMKDAAVPTTDESIPTITIPIPAMDAKAKKDDKGGEDDKPALEDEPDKDGYVTIRREVIVDPTQYRSPNYIPIPEGVDPDTVHLPSDFQKPQKPISMSMGSMDEAIHCQEAVAMDAAKKPAGPSVPCKTTFAQCQAKNPLLCPYHGSKLIEQDLTQQIRAAGLANASVVVQPSPRKAEQAHGKGFLIEVKCLPKDKANAEKILDNLLAQPGFKTPQGGSLKGFYTGKGGSSSWQDFFDVDLLRANQAPQTQMEQNAAAANKAIPQQTQAAAPSPAPAPTPKPAPAPKQTTSSTQQPASAAASSSSGPQVIADPNAASVQAWLPGNATKHNNLWIQNGAPSAFANTIGRSAILGPAYTYSLTHAGNGCYNLALTPNSASRGGQWNIARAVANAPIAPKGYTKFAGANGILYVPNGQQPPANQMPQQQSAPSASATPAATPATSQTALPATAQQSKVQDQWMKRFAMHGGRMVGLVKGDIFSTIPWGDNAQFRGAIGTALGKAISPVDDVPDVFSSLSVSQNGDVTLRKARGEKGDSQIVPQLQARGFVGCKFDPNSGDLFIPNQTATLQAMKTAQPAASTAASPTSQTASQGTAGALQQQSAPGYAPRTSTADDRKFLAEAKQGGIKKADLANLETLIKDKEAIESAVEDIKAKMASAHPSLQQGFQTVLDYSLGGLKDADEAVFAESERLRDLMKPKNCQPAGASCADIKANLQKMGATFIPKVLDTFDAHLAAKETQTDSRGQTDTQRVWARVVPELSDPKVFAKANELVSKSISAYLERCAVRSRIPDYSIEKYFISKRGYFNNYGNQFQAQQYGMASTPSLKEMRLCASTNDADRDGFAPYQSDWGDSAYVQFRKSNTFMAWTDHNTGGCGGSFNMVPFSKPSLLGMEPRTSGSNGYVSWIRKMLQTGKPDLTLDRKKFEQMNAHGHDEVHVFVGSSNTSTNEDILKHIEEFGFKSRTEAEKLVKKHGTLLKQFGIKVFYTTSGDTRTEVPNP